ncbi:MAG TPA: response regulator transcription factor [Actinomycetota bacterium]|nr:response regulator transcription factor [Actinomycetota bacterium]
MRGGWRLLEGRISQGRQCHTATKAIKQASPETRVILFMEDESRALVSDAIRAGVSGFLLKDADANELGIAARLALKDKAVIPPALTAAYIEGARLAGQPIGSPPLSKREEKTLQLMTDGATGERIAKALGISRNTVIHNIHRIHHKLGVRSQMEAMAARFLEAIEEPEPKTRTEWIHRLPSRISVAS